MIRFLIIKNIIFLAAAFWLLLCGIWNHDAMTIYNSIALMAVCTLAIIFWLRLEHK